MKLYRFSPISSETELWQAVAYLHRSCHELCFRTFGRYLPVRGNVGIFAHYEDESVFLTSLRQRLTDPKLSYKSKYFKLLEPVVIQGQRGVPAATYDFLYVRRVDPYRSQVGDIDFVLRSKQHEAVKAKLKLDTFVNGARLFGRPEENMIELWHPDIDAAAYVATQRMRPNIGNP